MAPQTHIASSTTSTPGTDSDTFLMGRPLSEAGLAALDILLFATLLLTLPAMLRMSNNDITAFYIPWLQHLLHEGRWAGLESSYADYNPPYLYLLSLGSLLAGKVPLIFIIKLIEVPGILFAGYLGGRLAFRAGALKRYAVLLGCLMALSPEVVVNGLLWGQVDILYSAFLLLALFLLVQRKFYWGMAAFGLAVAIKLQAMIVAVTLLAMLAVGELPALSLACAIGAYVAMMVPAYLAGRPARQLLLIYRNQFHGRPDVALNVANPYQLINDWASRSLHLERLIATGGLLFTGVCTLGMLAFLVRNKRLLRGPGLIAGWTLPLLCEPFLLPKMHDRYFFCADLLLVLLAGLNRSFLLPALLTQAAALMVYHRYLDVMGFPSKAYIVPVLMMSVAIVLFLRTIAARTPERVAEATS